MTAPRWVLTRNRIDWRLPLLDLIALLTLAIIQAAQHDSAISIAIAVPLSIVGVLQLVGLYRTRLTLSALDELPRLVGWVLVVTGLVCAVLLPGAEIVEALRNALLAAGLLFVLHTVYYGIMRRLRRSGEEWRMRAAIVGSGTVGQELIESARALPEYGIDPVVGVSADPLESFVATGIPIENDVRRLRQIVVDWKVDVVIVAFKRTPDSALVTPLRECDMLNCEVYIVPRLFEFTPLTTNMDRIHTIPLIRVRRDALRTWYWKLKRVFDVTVVSIALLLLSPLLAGVAAAVKLSDPAAPVIFRQQRIGKDGRLFDVLKFRSMKPVPAEVSDADWHPTSTDRIGPVGRVIRKTSLDELPQLWNVLRGDMSIVGPRPERPHFVDQFQTTVPSYRDRHRVDVGLTGWAAINGLRGDTSIEDRAMYDNFYIENWSVWLDIKIILRTIGVVFRGTGE